MPAAALLSLPFNATTFIPAANSSALGVLPEPLPAGYPTVGFYGTGIVNGGAAGAVQLKVDVTGVSLGKASISLTAVANGELRIEGEALKAGDRIEIYRLSGSLVSVHEVSGRAVAIDVSHLAAGAYIVKEGKQAAKVTVK